MFLVKLGLILKQREIEFGVSRLWQPRYLDLSHPDFMKVTGDLTPNGNHPPGVRIYAQVISRAHSIVKVQSVGLIHIKKYRRRGF